MSRRSNDSPVQPFSHSAVEPFSAALRPLLSASRRILLISHVAPDGDAIGSLLALKGLLEGQGKDLVAANQDGVPASLRFLPGWEQVMTTAGHREVDLIITLDSSDLARLGTVYRPSIHGQLPLANIDHHVTNLHFGSLNLVDAAAASTCELVFQLAEHMAWLVSPAIAQCLLTGVITDTHCFRTTNVTAPLLAIAQRLMDAGASLTAVIDNALERRSMAALCVWGRALSNARLQGRIIWTAIPQTLRQACQAPEHVDAGLVSHLLTVEEAAIAVVFSEREDGTVDVSIRSIPGIDISRAALSLGGGGHPQASGCSLSPPLPAAQTLVLATLQAVLAAQEYDGGDPL